MTVTLDLAMALTVVERIGVPTMTPWARRASALILEGTILALPGSSNILLQVRLSPVKTGGRGVHVDRVPNLLRPAVT